MNRRELLLSLAGAAALPLLQSRYALASAGTGPTQVLTPEKFGAIGDGKVSDEKAFIALLNEVNGSGGGVLIRCRPDAIYPITADKLLTVSNVTLDGQGCSFTGGGRWEINGDPGVAGGRPRVREVHFRNFQLRAVGKFNASKGPRFTWVEDSSLSDIRKVGATGTYFNFHTSRNCHASRLTGIGSRGGFGFLMFHCQNCSLSDAEFTDENDKSTHPIVVQVKGGLNNRVSRVTARGVVGERTNAVFFCRGDAPYRSAPALGTYPYANGKTWEAPDGDRQTRAAIWEDCAAVDCGGNNAFLFQESADCRFLRCVSIRSGAFRAIATQGGREHGAAFVDCRSEDAHGDAFNIAGKSAENSVTGVSLENVKISSPRGVGIRLRFADGARLNRVEIDAAGADGLLIEDCDKPQLLGINVKGSRRGGVVINRARGLANSLSVEIKSSDNAAGNLRINP